MVKGARHSPFSLVPESKAPRRLLTPLKRIGAKGPGSQFVPISWHEALTEISQRLQQVIDEYGAEAVLPYSYSGTLGYLQGEGMATRFFNRMGASQLARTICAEAGFHGYSYTLGAAVGMEPESYAHARLIPACRVMRCSDAGSRPRGRLPVCPAVIGGDESGDKRKPASASSAWRVMATPIGLGFR